jgi:hypothetical protein
MFAARRSLKRRETEPSGEVAALGKGLGRRCESGDRGGGDQADARNEIRDLAVETGE